MIEQECTTDIIYSKITMITLFLRKKKLQTVPLTKINKKRLYKLNYEYV